MWRSDLSEKVDICKDLEISVYAVFSPYKVTSKIYNPPFLRVLILKDDETYKQEELRSITLKEGEGINEKNIIDISTTLPFRLGLMQLRQQHEGELPLFRLIFIDPSEPRILPSITEKAREAEEKVKELGKNINKYREKFGELK